MHKRYITVPKNEEGIQEYNVGIESSDNLNEYVLPEEEFDRLWPAFIVINEQMGLLIDEYESEIIWNIHLKNCKNILLKMEVDCPIFLSALEEAIKYNTMLALDL